MKSSLSLNASLIFQFAIIQLISILVQMMNFPPTAIQTCPAPIHANLTSHPETRDQAVDDPWVKVSAHICRRIRKLSAMLKRPPRRPL
jgi:hypothetical protein